MDTPALEKGQLMYAYVVVEHSCDIDSEWSHAKIQAICKDMPDAKAYVEKEFGEPVKWSVDEENNKKTEESEALGEIDYVTIDRYEVIQEEK